MNDKGFLPIPRGDMQNTQHLVSAVRVALLMALILCLFLAMTSYAPAQQLETVTTQPGVTAVYLGEREAGSAPASISDAQPLAVTAAPTPSAVLSFNPDAVGVAFGSAQQLTASFLVSGYAGSFTPTASLHYGHDYDLSPVNCTPSGASETCNLTVTFLPTLPGSRKDAIFLMNGTTRLATVLLNGIGQGPLSLIQPGAFTTSVPSSSINTSGYNYVYQSVTDENGTVYILPSGNADFIVSVTKAGAATQIPLTTPPYFWSIGIDGAGVLYVFGESRSVTTWDTVQNIQGTYLIPDSQDGTDWYPGAVDGGGNVYVVEPISNNGKFFEFKPDGSAAFADVLAPAVIQPGTLAVDSAGDVFVGGYTINEITAGGVQTQVNTVGASDGLAVDAADTLYATRYTASGGVAELPASDYSTAIASIDTHSSPLGVSLGSDGTVYVSNYINLDIFDRSTTETIDFGEVSATLLKTDSSASIYNGGNEPLTLSWFKLTGPGFSVGSPQPDDCFPGMVLAPGSLCQVSATFAPPHAGTYSGVITVESNSLNGTDVQQTIQLTGTSDGSYDVLSPSPLVFPGQSVGVSATLPVTMTNEGSYYSSTVYSVKTDNPAFTIAEGACTSVTVAVGSSCQLQVAFQPAAAQAYTGNATIDTFVNGTNQAHQIITLPLSGTGTGPAAATPVITPGTGTYSSSQQVAITDATANATIYYTTDGSAPSSASTKYTSAINVSSNETINAIATATGYSQSATATATYTFAYPAITFTPASVSFTNQTVNTTSGTQTVTLSNTGSAALTISSIAVTGANASDFAETNNCPASLAAGSTCEILVTFTPASVASFSAAVSVSDNATGSPQSVVLTGTGTAAPAPVAALTPASLAFGNVVVPTTSAMQTATLKNTGNAALAISSIALAGTNPTDFAQTNNCGGSLAPGISCQISVTFTPASAASFAATIVVTDNAAGSPHQVALSGTGIVQSPVLTLSPATLSFGNQVVNTNSPTKFVTVTNTSTTDTIMVGSIFTTSSAAILAQSLDCGAPLAPGKTCEVLVNFDPSAIQAYSGTVTLQPQPSGCGGCVRNYPAQTIAVTGTGIAQPTVLSITPTTLNFGNQDVNTNSAAKPVTVTNTSTTDTIVLVTFPTTSSAAIGAVSPDCGSPLAPGKSCTVEVTFNPSAIQAYSGTVNLQPQPSGCGGCVRNYPTQTIAVTGTGIAAPPAFAISPAVVPFGNQIVNTKSANQTITLTNTTNDIIKVQAITSSDPAFANNANVSGCGLGLAPGVNCSVWVSFSPSAAHPYSATLTIQASDITNPAVSFPTQTFTATGTGTGAPPAFAISPVSLAFGNQAVGITSANKTVTLTNTTNDIIKVHAITSSDPAFANNASVSGCELGLAPGVNCSVWVSFSPSAVQSYSATLTVQASDITNPAVSFPMQTVTVTGTGIAQPPLLSLTPASLNFSNQVVNTSSAVQSVTVTNLSTTDTIVLSSFPPTSSAAILAQSADCGSPLAPGKTCTISVSFAPSAIQAYSGTVILEPQPSGCGGCVRNYPKQTIAVTGSGIAPPPLTKATPASLDFGSVAVNKTLVHFETITNVYTNLIRAVSATSSDAAFVPDLTGSGYCVTQPGKNCLLVVTFTPTAIKSYSATITYTFQDTNNPNEIFSAQTFNVTGSGISPNGVMSISPASLNFGNQAVDSISAAQSVTLTNTSTDTVLLNNVAGDGGIFLSLATSCHSPVAPGTSCTLPLVFSPTAVQAYNQTITFTLVPVDCGCVRNYPEQAFTVTGTGTPRPPVLVISPATVNFGNQEVNRLSVAQTVTITNISKTDTITIPAASFDPSDPAFIMNSANCAAPLAPGSSCAVSVALLPSSLNTYSATVTLQPQASGCGGCVRHYTAQTLALTGTAIPQTPVMSVSPAALNFGSQAINLVGAPLPVTLTNTSNSEFIILGSASSSDNAFGVARGNCASPVAPGASCNLSVTFTPTAGQPYSATVSFQPFDANCGDCSFKHQSFTVTGTGVAPQALLSTQSLSFSTTVGTTSAPQTATLSNTGQAPLSIISISLAGDNPNNYQQTNNCPLMLDVGANCTISITFLPPSNSSYPATLNITDNDPSGTQTVDLAGAGSNLPDFVIASLTPQLSVQPGNPAVFSIQVTAQNGATIPAVTLSASGLPPGATATFSQSKVAPGTNSATTTLTIQTASPFASNGHSAWPAASPVLALVALIFIPRNRRRRLLALVLVLAASFSTCAALSGCGGGLTFLPKPSTYNITVTGTIGAVQQTTNLQLTVQ